MDDRHYLSEPRPVETDEEEPTWEVDVFRVGVEEPLLTLTINNSTLPPRCNKKKKVIWKLPDSTSQIPSFGSEDKRRLWNLFKQQKKVRRKSSKQKTKQQQRQQTNANNDTQQQQQNDTDSPSETQDATTTRATPADDPKTSSEEASKASKSDTNNDDELTNGNRIANDESGTPSSTTHYPPPPGFDNNAASTTTTTTATASNSATAASQPAAPPTLTTPTTSTAAATTRRTWRVPLEEKDGATLLARCFIDTYYALLHVGNYMELFGYFATTTTQKSLSVGDAHHVCTNPQQVLLQLQSLSKPTWHIKGVVAQVGILNSVVLLITGTVMLGDDSASPMSFCHSVTLVQLPQEENDDETTPMVREYQIHNDAMAFLN